MPRARLLVLLTLLTPAVAAAQPVPLVETFDPARPYSVTLETQLVGRLAVPQAPGKPPEVVPLTGQSLISYDEKVLPALDAEAARVVRHYRQVDIRRNLGDREQKAEVRAEVRRMVVLRGPKGKKVPFSPDGALTLAEIDVVKADLFSLALVPGLLPAKPVKPGDKWKASDLAVQELTDYETVDANTLAVEFLAVVTLDGQRLAKLGLSGSVAGSTEDGPSKQTITGSAFFDLDANRLTYLKIVGKSTLLSPGGTTAGEVAGTFVLKRAAVEPRAGLTLDALKAIDLAPTDANSQLLFDDPALGLRFLYPRRWRVALVEKDRVALDEANGLAGAVFTLFPPDKTPAAAAWLAEQRAATEKQGGTITATEAPVRTQDKPPLDRFRLQVTPAPTAKVKAWRLDGAVTVATGRGLAMAARLSEGPEQAALQAQVDAVLKSIELRAPAE